ncbi:MAG: metallophosphoesterase [Pirellulales bacterium]|nr:metallophosphoesterase [Pirellulales bacterium]
MDRRDFLVRGGTLLALLGGGQAAWAAETESNKKKKKKPAKKPEKPKLPVPPFVPGSWSLVILPDIQNYSTWYPGLIRLQAQWILDNKKKRNIVYVLQSGDVTNRNSKLEWERASRGLGLLDGKVPYALVPGNHDYGDKGHADNRETKINDYFPPSRFKDWPTFGGTMEKGRIENSFHLFEAGGKKWLVLGLEWGPRDETLRWADSILTKYADRKALVFTHAYLYNDSTRYDWAKKGRKQASSPHGYKTPGSLNDGEEIWQKVLRKHANVFMAMNGHVCGDGLGFQVSRGDHGNWVNEMLVNYQVQKIGGGAWLRLLEFLPDGKTIQAKTYSPLYEEYETSPDNQFRLQL